jgi:methylthioribose-1-phosphate isomerase
VQAIADKVTGARLKQEFEKICHTMASTRPTAVNLFWAIARMKRVAEETQGASLARFKAAMRREALHILAEDVEANKRIGALGSRLLKKGDTVLTHCNAGALATGGYGTALGIIRAAKAEGKEIKVFADETRPVLQGARLTAWELQKDRIPVTVITDSMAAYLMLQRRVDAVIVGADRIAANGDAVNKIGTYSLAVLAKEHGIPFYVAAPCSTIDLFLRTGKEAPIEERESEEVTQVAGKRVVPPGVPVWNPAFDVTPHRLIAAIITDKGIAKKPYRRTLKALIALSPHS